MMNGQTGHHTVKRSVVKRQCFGIAVFEFDIGQPGFRTALARFFQHRRCDVESDRLLRPLGNGGSHHPRTAGEIKDHALCGFTERLTKPVFHTVIRLRRIGIECLGLPGKFFFDALDVFHGRACGYWTEMADNQQNIVT